MYFLTNCPNEAEYIFGLDVHILPKEKRDRYLSYPSDENKSYDLNYLVKLGLDKMVIKAIIGVHTHSIIWNLNTGERVFDINPGTTYKDLEPYIGEVSDDEKNEIKALLMELKLIK